MPGAVGRGMGAILRARSQLQPVCPASSVMPGSMPRLTDLTARSRTQAAAVGNLALAAACACLTRPRSVGLMCCAGPTQQLLRRPGRR